MEYTDTERLAALRKFMGYVQNGTSDTITIYQDDTTNDFFIERGKRRFFGESFKGVLDAVVEFVKEED